MSKPNLETRERHYAENCELDDHDWKFIKAENDFDEDKHYIWMQCYHCEKKRIFEFPYTKIQGNRHTVFAKKPHSIAIMKPNRP